MAASCLPAGLLLTAKCRVGGRPGWVRLDAEGPQACSSFDGTWSRSLVRCPEGEWARGQEHDAFCDQQACRWNDRLPGLRQRASRQRSALPPLRPLVHRVGAIGKEENAGSAQLSQLADASRQAHRVGKRKNQPTERPCQLVSEIAPTRARPRGRQGLTVVA
jgi:hypothetical protein